MNAYQLYKQDGTPTDHWMCGKCNQATWPKTEQAATECCTWGNCRYCGKPVEGKGEPHGQPSRDHHSECFWAHYRQRDLEKLEAATLVETYDGFLYGEHLPGGRDGFFDDMETLLDDLADGDVEPGTPMFAFCCEPNRHDLDLDTILENATSDGYEDMENCVAGTAELGKAIDAFNELNKTALTTWHPNYKRKVRIPVEDLER